MSKKDKTSSIEAMQHDNGFLTGKLLLAMPSMTDPRFERSVVYICAHSDDGAMGIVINQPLIAVDFKELMEQLEIPESEIDVDPVIHFGGPVETGRGFVLHSTDFVRADTMMVNENFAITATIDILKAIAGGAGPRESLFALGYAGWDAGQLEAEMQANAWLTLEADRKLVFDPNTEDKWLQALGRLGIDPAMLSGNAGSA